MFVARVVGVTWATVKHEGLDNLKLLLVRQINPLDGRLTGKATMAVDGTVGAGIGDTVLIIDEGSSARQILGSSQAPIRTIVAGIIEEVAIGSDVVKYH
jgi:ethanolamine utilization protein EutN